jgi:hypothetical protein
VKLLFKLLHVRFFFQSILIFHRFVLFYVVYGCQQSNIMNYSMEQRTSSESNRSSGTQEIPHILWNLKVYYCIHKRLPSVPVLSQINPVYAPTYHFLKLHFNIFLLSVPRSSKWSVFLMFSHQNPVCMLPPYVLHVPPIHSYWFSEECGLWSSLCLSNVAFPNTYFNGKSILRE